MGLLDFDDTYIPPFQSKRYEKKEEDNFAELQNLGHEVVAEDYSDSKSLK